MQRITCRIDFVTPAFIGGSDPSHSEFTGSTVRGQLRWWFRAVAGGALDGNKAAVANAERHIFGSSERRAQLRVLVIKSPDSVRDPFPANGLGTDDLLTVAGAPATDRARLHLLRNGTEVRANPLGYLGYGPVGMRGDATRDYAPPGSAAAFALQGVPPSPIFLDALWSWLHLGSMGSRSRRGFGSIRCTSVDGAVPADAPSLTLATVADFDTAVSAVLNRNWGTNSGPVEWSRFSPDAHVYRALDPSQTWQDAMRRAAAWLIAFRRRYGMGINRDYDWMKGIAKPPYVPDRAGFGLPLPFGHGSGVESWPGGRRRGSPVLLRISKFGGDYYPVFTHLPSLIVPPGDNIRVRTANNTTASALPSPQQNAIVSDFLKELCTRGKANLVA